MSDEDIFSSKSRKVEVGNRESLSRKRKLSSLTSSNCDSDDDLGIPLAESTVLKKKRDDSDTISDKCENSHLRSSSNLSIITEKGVNAISITKCKFLEFLHDSGIKINPVVPHVLCKYINYLELQLYDGY